MIAPGAATRSSRNADPASYTYSNTSLGTGVALVGSLIVMVMFSGYENFVSTIDAKGTDTLNWLGKLDAGTLKLKVAASIVAISSIHLLGVFVKVEKIENDKIMWYVIVHMTFVISAVLLGVLDKMSFAKHRDH